ncbi:hypothetical protein [Kitasatospora sp. GP82]|uniref:hypothetical protein n=1 Tax=Kitasatospora sp. GP82 TaxID=3035089 RepID=UPI002476B234|nr:hypothetical protein [Kitasatospora sp. GP82]MDH6126078.1 hypothetical protein [Kitasatospora sp. GP82]
MANDQFGYQMQELAKIEQDWRSVGERMEQLNRQLGQITQTLAKATAIDLASSQFAGIPGFGIAFQVLDDVKQIEDATKRLKADKEKLAKQIADGAERMRAVKAEYEAAEKKIEDELRKHEHQNQPPTSPKPQPQPPTSGSGGHGGGSGGHGGGSGEPGGHEGGGSGGDGGGGSHGAPDGHVSTASEIKVSEVTYGGAGSWKSGQAATEDYINQALDKMGITDPQARANWMRGMLTIAERESSYNAPHSQICTWDSNARGERVADGAPAECSRGGWQCIPSTFAAYHQPGTATDIYDPVANCAASMNYIMDTYHVSRDGSNLTHNVQQADASRPPKGY